MVDSPISTSPILLFMVAKSSIIELLPTLNLLNGIMSSRVYDLTITPLPSLLVNGLIIFLIHHLGRGSF
ncbi:MAG: hypothetical protein RLZZ175_2247 [Bacteroidota bacterium]|jgi:hypothetical protein